MSRTTWRAILASSAAVAVLFAANPVATAQSSSLGSSSDASANDVLLDIIAGSSQQLGSTELALGGLLSSAGLLSSDPASRFPEGLMSSDSDYPLKTVDDITEVALVERRVEDAAENRERWFIASPSMKRIVEVQVQKAADPDAPAPILYLLDGIGGNKRSSGWINQGSAQQVLGQENVTAVFPLGAAASMYTDWEQEDPALGTIKWETFITEELAPLLQSTEDLNFNGKSGIGGLSMGAIGAVQIANANPTLFDAAIGISGCYSTLDTLGYQTMNFIVTPRGGNLENMWGPVGSENWVKHDVTNDPSGLTDTALYLSAANGAAGDADVEAYSDQDFYNMLAGLYLERGVYQCTRNLEKSLEEVGATDVTVDYLDYGMHNWTNYNAQLQPAWDAIKHALF